MTIIINDELYSINQICELLGIEDFNLRYIEKTVGLNIERNNASEKIYSPKDVETLKFIFELNDKGLDYKTIKKVLKDSLENNYIKVL